MLRFLCLLFATSCALPMQPAQAHLTPNSEVQLAFGQREVLADLIIPLGEYAYATANPTGNDPASLKQAAAFLTRNIRVTTPKGVAWTLRIERVEFVQVAGPPDLHAIVRLTPPAGESPRHLTINWRAIIDQVPSHFVLFVAISDFSGGMLDEERQILGAVQRDRRTLTIDRGTANLGHGFQAAVGLGMRHIAEGHDHLLFLITLLLPAPLLASGRRWGSARPARMILWHLVSIVSAFTVGHSITLIGAAVFDWRLPAQPVEILIALSILICSIHALRPLFPDREAGIAGGFGLVHGLAFATTVSHFGLGMEEKTLTILGFNIGIELVQLAVVLSVVPALLLLVRTPYYRILRRIAGGLAVLAALAWLAERATGKGNVFAAFIDGALNYAPWLVAILTLLGLFIHARSYFQSSPVVKQPSSNP